ncbi:MAG: sensor domain-containing diguanylate cyclase [Snowella sp.]|nr:sensor domain-containing diguanylate cyclase [Snowella sp.]
MLNNISLLNDFATAGKAVLEFLRQRFGFDLWMITRTEGNDWIVLMAKDHGYNVKEGSVFHWSDSFCSRMVEGLGPCIAPQANLITAYAEAPIGQQVPIGAYIGFPLTYSDGTLFGTLCAIDPVPHSQSLQSEQPLIELLAGLLSSLLNAELATLAAKRQAERAEAEAMSDALTTLYNRRGWDKLVAMEEERCYRYGHSVCVFLVDLDDLKCVNDVSGHSAGDKLLIQASQALKEALRPTDIVARLGGDEFAILAIECDQKNAQAIAHRIRHCLNAAGVKASIGYALRHPQCGIQSALQEADAAMYRDKARHKS